ncbi:MAG: hypothetical protein ACTSYH_05370 [Candidatus Heimdallarchaeaceae archaeon]
MSKYRILLSMRRRRNIGTEELGWIAKFAKIKHFLNNLRSVPYIVSNKYFGEEYYG